jgi:molybdate transport system substrate-binding protein
MRLHCWFFLAEIFGVVHADAAEIRVFTAGATEEPLRHIAADFTQATGHTVSFTVDTVGVLQRKLKSGEKPDAAVLSVAVVEALEKDGVLPAGGRVELARVLMGVGVREGAPLPDISTPEAFRQTLLAARSVAVTDPAFASTAGLHFVRLLQGFGIVEEIGKKSVLRPGGKFVADALAKGEAEIGITFVSEMLPVKGIRVVGPLPDAIQSKTAYAAAIPDGAPDAARAFIAFAATPQAAKHFEAAGLEAVAKKP